LWRRVWWWRCLLCMGLQHLCWGCSTRRNHRNWGCLHGWRWWSRSGRSSTPWTESGSRCQSVAASAAEAASFLLHWYWLHHLLRCWYWLNHHHLLRCRHWLDDGHSGHRFNGHSVPRFPIAKGSNCESDGKGDHKEDNEGNRIGFHTTIIIVTIQIRAVIFR